MSNDHSRNASSQPTNEQLQQRVAELEATVARLQAERDNRPAVQADDTASSLHILNESE